MAVNLTMGMMKAPPAVWIMHGVIAKYQPLANVISQALNAKVDVVFIREFKALETARTDARFGFVMARPSDYPARGLRDYGYHFIASAKPGGNA